MSALYRAWLGVKSFLSFYRPILRFSCCPVGSAIVAESVIGMCSLNDKNASHQAGMGIVTGEDCDASVSGNTVEW